MFVQKYFVVHELWAGKNSFITYLGFFILVSTVGSLGLIWERCHAMSIALGLSKVKFHMCPMHNNTTINRLLVKTTHFSGNCACGRHTDTRVVMRIKKLLIISHKGRHLVINTYLPI